MMKKQTALISNMFGSTSRFVTHMALDGSVLLLTGPSQTITPSVEAGSVAHAHASSQMTTMLAMARGNRDIECE